MTEKISEVLGNAEKKVGRRRALRNVGILAALVLVVVAASSYFRVHQPSVSYITAKVKRGDLTVLVTTTGALQPLKEVQVGTEVSGTIESVTVDYNEHVTVGQILAELDTDQLEARYRQSQAALALAEARVMEAKATVTETGNQLHRTQDLIAKRLSSQEELDRTAAAYARAEAGLAVANAQVDQSKAQLDSDRRALEKAVIRSPIDGIVLERRIEPGQTVAATLQTPVLFTLAEDLRNMELRVDLDEADVGQVRTGQQAVFSVDAYPDRSFPAQVKQVRFAPREVNGVVTYETLLSVENADLLLRPGMTATAEITVMSLRDVVLIPNAALRFNPPLPDSEGSRQSPGGLFGMFVPAPPADRKPEVHREGSGESRVWVLKDGVPAPVAVKTGPTDGAATQLIEGDVAPGTPLIIDMVKAGS